MKRTGSSIADGPSPRPGGKAADSTSPQWRRIELQLSGHVRQVALHKRCAKAAARTAQVKDARISIATRRRMFAASGTIIFTNER